MRYIFLFFFLFFLGFTVDTHAQNLKGRLDSLLSINSNYKNEDSIKIKNLRAIYRQYMRMKNTGRVEYYVNQVVALSSKLRLRNYEAEAYFRRGLFYHSSTNYEKAESNYLKSIAVYTAINDLDWAASIYLNLGALYIGIPDYAKALEANQRAISVFQKNGNEIDLASCYANISGIYEDLDQQDNALFYLQKALKIFEKGDENNRGVAVVTNSIGSAYLTASSAELAKMGVKPELRNKLALEYFNRSLKVSIAINDNGCQASASKNLGKVYEAMGDRRLALNAYKTSVEKNSEEDDKRDYALSLLALADFYKQDGEYVAAGKLFLDALKIGKEKNLLEVQRNAYLGLSELEEKNVNFSGSLAYYKKYIEFKEQIFNEEKEKEITRKQLQINFAVKEKDYQLKQQKTDGELLRQVLLAKQQQQLLTLRQQRIDLQRLTFLTRQNELEKEKNSQKEMYNREQLQSSLDKTIKDREISFQRSELKFNRNINIFLIVLAVILFGSAVVVIYAQRRTSKLNKIISHQKLELEKLGQVKDRIFSVVGHDMRSPVNSLISFIQLLEDGAMSQQDLTRYASQLKNSLAYTSVMMENLLSWASSQMQGFKPVIEQFSIAQVVKEVVDSLTEAANKKNINIEYQIKSTALALADINMTGLVFRNLISNAIKFTRVGGRIDISMTETSDSLLVGIQDNGVGLSELQIATFNEARFDENAKTTLGTNNEKGTGIGLMLCRTFSNLMQGSLQVKSQLAKGTKFTLSLPKAVEILT